MNTDFLLLEFPVEVGQAIQQVKQSKARLIILKESGEIKGVCDSHNLFLQSGEPDRTVCYCTDFKLIPEDFLLTKDELHFSYYLVMNEKEEIIGWFDRVYAEKVYDRQAENELMADLEAIVESIYDEILVIDPQGTILRVMNRHAHKIWGMDPASVIGKNIFDLEEKGWFKPLVTRQALKERQKVSLIQENRFGRKILAVGNPIFNEHGHIDRIVVASRDITDVTKWQEPGEGKDVYQKVRSMQKPMIYQSLRMKELVEEVERVARVESTVMIYGESGVGKELVANAIHELSARAGQPFIKINCGSIPENLLESELFGYEKGAFTGALHKGKKGLFELANKGTLFLDEISELPLNLQTKLLRVLQEREILKIGGTKPIPIDVRVITATNRDLEEMVAKGDFREDLFYRLHVIPLYVPALRERIEDVEPLLYYFLEHFNEKFAMKKYFSEDAIEMLKAYHWPGNVRQLQNVVERAMVLTDGQLITANDLAKILVKQNQRPSPVQVNEIIPLRKAVEMTESQLIRLALSKYKTLTEVAKVLEVSQPTISRRYQQWFKNQ